MQFIVRILLIIFGKIEGMISSSSSSSSLLAMKREKNKKIEYA